MRLGLGLEDTLRVLREERDAGILPRGCGGRRWGIGQVRAGSCALRVWGQGWGRCRLGLTGMRGMGMGHVWAGICALVVRGKRWEVGRV